MGKEMRGTWNKLGLCWHCDCRGGVLLKVHHSNEQREEGQKQSPRKTYCKRCQISRPPMKDKPKLPQTTEEFQQLMKPCPECKSENTRLHDSPGWGTVLICDDCGHEENTDTKEE